MNSRILILIVAAIFLLTHSGCASFKNNQIQTTSVYSENTVADFDTQKKKEEREFLLMVLIVLGIAIALGATISAASGGGGFFMGINN